MTKNVLSLKHVTKVYPGVVALDDLSLDIREGEIHALVGENGAGKSTMLKIISGAIMPTEGIIEIFGKTYDNLTPALARQLGVEIVYQEFNLVPSLSVCENIFLGTEEGVKPFPDFRKMEKKTREIFRYMNVEIDPKEKVSDLSTAYCQLVEIAKALSKNVKILILDEPTASLTTTETETLFELVKKLKENGTTILYVSHRMSEIFEFCERATVLRDGKLIKTTNIDEIDRKKLIELMVGRELDETYPEKKAHIGEVILEAKNICGLGVENISFQLHRGEILGFGGLVGAGRTEIIRVLYGADVMDNGEVLYKGKPVEIKNPTIACALGIGLVPEDRKLQGVIQTLSIRKNISLTILKLISKLGFLDFKKENQILEKHKNSLQIKTPSLNQLVKNLSGGNQQKVALSKWLARECDVLIVDEPTRGIDVGAKKEIYNILEQLTEQGMAIIMISSDMPELIGMSDRILVMSEGRQTGIIERKDFSQEKILELASTEFVANN